MQFQQANVYHDFIGLYNALTMGQKIAIKDYTSGSYPSPITGFFELKGNQLVDNNNVTVQMMPCNFPMEEYIEPRFYAVVKFIGAESPHTPPSDYKSPIHFIETFNGIYSVEWFQLVDDYTTQLIGMHGISGMMSRQKFFKRFTQQDIQSYRSTNQLP